MKKGKKLTLAKETVRDLEQRSLERLAGASPEVCTRNSSCDGSCWFTGC